MLLTCSSDQAKHTPCTLTALETTLLGWDHVKPPLMFGTMLEDLRVKLERSVLIVLMFVLIA